MTLNVGWLAVVLGVIWFVAYGIGTTWQVVHENPRQNFTRWTIVTQGFSNGLWAAVGWPAAYVLWVLRPTSPSDLTLGHVALLCFAVLSVTGWLPGRLKEIFGRS